MCDAKWISIREFAVHLGVSERMISKWEAGRQNITPRPVSQAALGTCLSRSDSRTPTTRLLWPHEPMQRHTLRGQVRNSRLSPLLFKPPLLS
ncbi:helix-turn-helix domain-containing protein [Actinocrispum wychmicini]|uniref:Helix-turn-helix protein n=1 Tax=Actinocrispum wychmicini TaxID=1213861 RepID=A0A4R2JJL5_9PSEU|nr:helix-turn-helix transcriptional regulator [Actinocrispum wychmicini]TCO59324.1 helix-turn-helix protein [Actinocrispum wychmicini]